MKHIAYKDAFRDMYMRPRSFLDDFSPFIKRTMTNTPVPLRTHVEVRPGGVLQTDAAVMNVRLIGRKWHYVALMDEAPVHDSGFPHEVGGQGT